MLYIIFSPHMTNKDIILKGYLKRNSKTKKRSKLILGIFVCFCWASCGAGIQRHTYLWQTSVCKHIITGSNYPPDKRHGDKMLQKNRRKYARPELLHLFSTLIVLFLYAWIYSLDIFLCSKLFICCNIYNRKWLVSCRFHKEIL